MPVRRSARRHPAPVRNDAEIIATSLDDPDAFGEIFERYFQPIRAFVVSRVGTTAGPDLAAQVFVTAFANRAKFDLDYPSAKPWLYGIASNLIRREFRKAKRGRRAVLRFGGREAADVVSDPIHQVDERFEVEDRARRVRDALAQLRPQDREIILLATWEGLSYAEISESLGIPVGTVRSRLARSRERLRELAGDIGQSDATGSSNS